MTETSTTQTQTTATPAADRFAQLEAQILTRRAEFEATERAALSTRTVAQLRDDLKVVNVYGQPIPSTKAELIDRIVTRRWVQSAVYQEFLDARNAADWESRIIENATTNHASMALVSFAESARPGLKGPDAIEAACRYAHNLVAAELWGRVRVGIERGDTPQLALERVQRNVTSTLLGQFTHRATSRSTSVAHNLNDDVRREAMAEWLNETTSRPW